MPIVKSIKGKKPTSGHDCWFADNAAIVGDVKMGRSCTVWFNAVVRGDVSSITIGNNTNVQDGAVIHSTYEKSETKIGSNVSIGHNAVIHGCTIEDNVLIGMGAIIMDNAVIGRGSIIGAGTIVTEGVVTEPSSVYIGNRARKIKDTGEKEIEAIMRTAKNYITYADWYR